MARLEKHESMTSLLNYLELVVPLDSLEGVPQGRGLSTDFSSSPHLLEPLIPKLVLETDFGQEIEEITFLKKTNQDDMSSLLDRLCQVLDLHQRLLHGFTLLVRHVQETFQFWRINCKYDQSLVETTRLKLNLLMKQTLDIAHCFDLPSIQ